MLPEVKLVYDQIKEWTQKNEKPNASSIIILTTLIIKNVEKISKDKSGDYKKQIVIDVLYQVIKESKLEDDAKLSLMYLVDTTIPSTIDTMIGIANHKIDLGKVKSVTSRCCFW